MENDASSLGMRQGPWSPQLSAEGTFAAGDCLGNTETDLRVCALPSDHRSLDTQSVMSMLINK